MKILLKASIRIEISMLILFIGFATINVICKYYDSENLSNIYIIYSSIVGVIALGLIGVLFLPKNLNFNLAKHRL